MQFDFSSVKRKLESKTCPEHREHAKVSVSKDSITITQCCCEAFKASLTKIAKQGIADASKKAVTDEFSKMLKKSGFK